MRGEWRVLGESSATTALLFQAFFVDESQVDVFDAFDAVLIEHPHRFSSSQ